MADQKITELTELEEAPNDSDLATIVDVSDTTMDATGTNKKITCANLQDHAPKAHASSHIDGTDNIDGDKIDVDFSPSNYTPDASPAEADDVDDLAAHLKGIDTEVGHKRTMVQHLCEAEGTDGTFEGTHPVRYSETSLGDGKYSWGFVVPSDFTTLESAKIVMIAKHGSGDQAYNPDIYSEYAADGESHDNHSESKTDYSETLADEEVHFWDVSSILSSIAVGDLVGIRLDYVDENTDGHFGSLIIEYT